MKCGLSLIFPIFNEGKRIENSLNKIQEFTSKNTLFDLEVILVNDGSYDNTNVKIQRFINSNLDKNFKYIKSAKNKGKGHALKFGVENATKEWILTSDIDLSVPLEQIQVWFSEYNFSKNSIKVYFGSRGVHRSNVKKKIHRFILGIIFKKFIKLFFKINIKDTQCGYKLYENQTAKHLFKDLEIFGFAHDIELIMRLNDKNIEIKELPVNWTHMPGSKLNIFIDPIKMLIDLFKIFIILRKR
jgi:glycosyltransferase involved in cell wall biosynthesis